MERAKAKSESTSFPRQHFVRWLLSTAPHRRGALAVLQAIALECEFDRPISTISTEQIEALCNMQRKHVFENLRRLRDAGTIVPIHGMGGGRHRPVTYQLVPFEAFDPTTPHPAWEHRSKQKRVPFKGHLRDRGRKETVPLKDQNRPLKGSDTVPLEGTPHIDSIPLQGDGVGAGRTDQPREPSPRGSTKVDPLTAALTIHELAPERLTEAQRELIVRHMESAGEAENNTASDGPINTTPNDGNNTTPED